ncbi:MAG: tetratricopeptide repeat protein [Victivallaceae bacterium]
MIMLLSGLILRIVYLCQFSGSPLFSVPIGPDIQEYHDWAQEMIADGIVWSKIHIHGPTYPVFLAALYKLFNFNLPSVRVVQLLLGMAGLIACYFALKKAALPRIPRYKYLPEIFLGIAMLYPPLIYYQAEIISESLQVPLLCACVALLYFGEKQKEKNAIVFAIFALAGLAAGLAATAHPMTLVFVLLEWLALILFALYSGTDKRFCMKKLLFPVVFIGFAALPVLPVCIHNSLLAKRLVLIQDNSALNWFIGNNPAATGTCYVRPGRPWSRMHAEAGNTAIVLRKTKDQVFMQRVYDFIKTHPAEELKLLWRKTLLVWNWRELASGSDVDALLRFTPVQKYTPYAFALLGIFGLTGMIMILSRRRSIVEFRHFLILAISFWAAQILTVTSGRYRLAMIPALFVFAAFFISMLRFVLREKAAVAKTAIATGIAAVIVLLPEPAINHAQLQAEAESLLGEACFKQGKYVPAAQYLTLAAKYLDDPARCFNLLGVIAQKNSPADADKYFELAIAAAPEEPEAYMNLAISASAHNDVKLAEKYFAVALKHGADNSEVLYNYGFFLQSQHKISQAETYYRESLKSNPANRKALNSLGVIYMMLKRPATAVTYFSAAVSLDPGDSRMLLNLAAAYASAGDTSKALKITNKILGIDPQNSSALTLKKMFEANH